MTDQFATLQDTDACYAILKAHDSRFDGRLFIGIATTGIYCRPVCRVRLPKAENCTYFSSAAAAEAAGFRPCLKCRPELAPGVAPVYAAKRIAAKAARMIEEDCLADSSIAGLAANLNISARHLHRVFVAEFGVTPVQYLQTRRLLMAKNLLTETDLVVTEVALAAGFGSIRRFNHAFMQHYKLAPGALRKKRETKVADAKEEVTFRLSYRPPYAWTQLLEFLALRAIPGVEAVANGSYRRTVNINTATATICGWFSVQNDAAKNQLLVTVASALLPVIVRVLTCIRRQFDLDCEPDKIYEQLRVMNTFAANLCRPGTRLPGCFEPYEMAVRAILGQQITVKAARTLAQRLVKAYGTETVTPYAELTHVFPEPQTICRQEPPIGDRLGPLGITGARARSILALSEALMQGTLALTWQADVEEEMRKLLALPGIGPWTAQYIAMRGMNWPDAFPHTDLGVKKALKGKSANEILNMAEAWRPWRSYATMNLWHSL